MIHPADLVQAPLELLDRFIQQHVQIYHSPLFYFDGLARILGAKLEV